MTKFFAILLLGAVPLIAMPVHAADTKASNSQQNKMKDCQAQAGDKKLEGKDRQDYVNKCLKAKPAKAESKMAECNKKTAGMKGEERAKAQSECMKG